MIDPSLASLGVITADSEETLPILRRSIGLTESDHAQGPHQRSNSWTQRLED